MQWQWHFETSEAMASQEALKPPLPRSLGALTLGALCCLVRSQLPRDFPAGGSHREKRRRERHAGHPLAVPAFRGRRVSEDNILEDIAIPADLSWRRTQEPSQQPYWGPRYTTPVKLSQTSPAVQTTPAETPGFCAAKIIHVCCVLARVSDPQNCEHNTWLLFHSNK